MARFDILHYKLCDEHHANKERGVAVLICHCWRFSDGVEGNFLVPQVWDDELHRMFRRIRYSAAFLLCELVEDSNTVCGIANTGRARRQSLSQSLWHEGMAHCSAVS